MAHQRTNCDSTQESIAFSADAPMITPDSFDTSREFPAQDGAIQETMHSPSGILSGASSVLATPYATSHHSPAQDDSKSSPLSDLVPVQVAEGQINAVRACEAPNRAFGADSPASRLTHAQILEGLSADPKMQQYHFLPADDLEAMKNLYNLDKAHSASALVLSKIKCMKKLEEEQKEKYAAAHSLFLLRECEVFSVNEQKTPLEFICHGNVLRMEAGEGDAIRAILPSRRNRSRQAYSPQGGRINEHDGESGCVLCCTLSRRQCQFGGSITERVDTDATVTDDEEAKDDLVARKFGAANYDHSKYGVGEPVQVDEGNLDRWSGNFFPESGEKMAASAPIVETDTAADHAPVMPIKQWFPGNGTKQEVKPTPTKRKAPAARKAKPAPKLKKAQQSVKAAPKPTRKRQRAQQTDEAAPEPAPKRQRAQQTVEAAPEPEAAASTTETGNGTQQKWVMLLLTSTGQKSESAALTERNREPAATMAEAPEDEEKTKTIRRSKRVTCAKKISLT